MSSCFCGKCILINYNSQIGPIFFGCLSQWQGGIFNFVCIYTYLVLYITSLPSVNRMCRFSRAIKFSTRIYKVINRIAIGQAARAERDVRQIVHVKISNFYILILRVGLLQVGIWCFIPKSQRVLTPSLPFRVRDLVFYTQVSLSISVCHTWQVW